MPSGLILPDDGAEIIIEPLDSSFQANKGVISVVPIDTAETAARNTMNEHIIVIKNFLALDRLEPGSVIKFRLLGILNPENEG